MCYVSSDTFYVFCVSSTLNPNFFHFFFIFTKKMEFLFYTSLFDRIDNLRFDVPMKSINGSGAMFDGIAEKYDLLNRVTSMGMDKKWRKKAVEALDLKPGQILLDLAAGTLDVSIAAAKRYPQIQILAADPSKSMIAQGIKKKAVQCNRRIEPLLCTGEKLPLASQCIHGAIIAFGIRNFSNRTLALQNIADVLCPQGKLVILELSLPQKGLFAPLARWYVKKIIPTIGGILSNKAEYTYLPKSMAAFPAPLAFCKELRTAGFEIMTMQPLMFGACHLFICKRN